MKFLEYIKSKKSNACIISKGLKLNPNFWKDFIVLANNSQELSSLLGVPRQKVATWHSEINKAIEEYNKNTNINKKNRIIKTGRKK